MCDGRSLMIRRVLILAVLGFRRITCPYLDVVWFGLEVITIILLRAIRTNTMAELGTRVLLDVALNLIPVPLVVPNLFAARADW